MKIVKSKNVERRPFAVKLASAMAGAMLTSFGHAALLEEIIVTAQKRAQNAQDIPIAVSAFTGEQLQELGVVSTAGLADNVPGVQVKSLYANAPSFTVRGMNANDYATATSPAVAIYQDGVYKASSINSGAQLFDIQQVEILKGPQGTLWGKNTTGGAVSITSVRPEQETSGYLALGTGSDSQYLVEGAIGGALSDTLSGRLSMQHIESDGPYNNVTFSTTGIAPGSIPLPAAASGAPAPEQLTSIQNSDADPGAIETMAVRGQLMWEPSDDLQVLLIGHYATDKSTTPAFVALLEDPDVFDDEVSMDMVSASDNEFYGVTADIRWQVGAGELVSISGWDAFDRRGQGVDQSYTVAIPGVGPFLAVPAAAPNLAVVYWTEFEQFSQELRYEVERDNLFWLAGLYYSETEYDQAGDNAGLGIFGTFGYFETQFRQKDESAAAFVHAEWSISDALKFNGGLRYSDESRDREAYQMYFEAPVPTQFPNFDFPGVLAIDANSALNPYPNEVNPSDFSYRLGIDWTPQDNMLVYYSLSKGFKSGGFDTGPVTSPANLAPIGDEEILAHEVGLKWDPTDTLRVNAAAFYSDYTNMQQRMSTDDDIFGTVVLLTNLDQVDVTGLELEMLWAPISGLELSATASFLDTEINDNSLISPVTGGVVDGNNLPGAPETAASLLARYGFDVGDGLRGSVQVGINYTGDHYMALENLSFNKQDYTIINARAAISDSAGNWEVSLYGQNLTDEIYITATAWEHKDYWISRPRTMGVRLDYRF